MDSFAANVLFAPQIGINEQGQLCKNFWDDNRDIRTFIAHVCVADVYLK